jgi:hypothetical protein
MARHPMGGNGQPTVNSPGFGMNQFAQQQVSALLSYIVIQSLHGFLALQREC